MDPEQIYQEVLQEEQGKGSPSAVAEARAKAARQRAVHGSPHPKDPKWWAGSQPRWEGGEGGAEEPAEAEEPVEEEAPAGEESAAQSVPEEPAADVERTDTPAPAAAPAAEAAPAPAAAASTPNQADPGAVATAPPPTGVTHGTPTGNRLRPEDGVASQAQFDGQQAMYERRKLIDDLVSTGVPAVAAEEAMRPRAPFLAVLYILIPILAVFVLLSQQEEGGTAEGGDHGGSEAPAEGGGEGGGGIAVTTQNFLFDPAELTVPAGEEVAIDYSNEDTAEHNISVYPDQEAGLAKSDAIFTGEIMQPGDSTTYNVPAVDAGEYYFQCDVHPNMNGPYVAE